MLYGLWKLVKGIKKCDFIIPVRPILPGCKDEPDNFICILDGGYGRQSIYSGLSSGLTLH